MRSRRALAATAHSQRETLFSRCQLSSLTLPTRLAAPAAPAPLPLASPEFANPAPLFYFPSPGWFSNQASGPRSGPLRNGLVWGSTGASSGCTTKVNVSEAAHVPCFPSCELQGVRLRVEPRLELPMSPQLGSFCTSASRACPDGLTTAGYSLVNETIRADRPAL